MRKIKFPFMRGTAMKQHLLQIVGTAALIACLAASAPSAARSDDTIRPASFLDVKFADSLWAARQETNRRTTIPYVLGQLKQRGSLSGFAVLAGQPGREVSRLHVGRFGRVQDPGRNRLQPPHESRSVAGEGGGTDHVALIVRAQAADGYLMPHLQIAEPGYTHYADETTRTCESYSQGHLIESAVAHLRGDRPA